MKCANCGNEHNNKKFCSYSCIASYNNRIRIISDITKKKLSKINKGKVGHKHSDETKKTISKKLKEFYDKNPDKHNWLVNRKKSKPCEFLKNYLRNKNIYFVEELKPLNDYAYSIDIALPEYKIGIEVNGNQHYKKGEQQLTLDDYYQNRHNLIEDGGWKLIELHYKTVYDKNIDLIIDKILKNNDFIYDVETKNYIIDCINRKKLCKKCGIEINIDNICDNCKNIKEQEKLHRLNIKIEKEIQKENIKKLKIEKKIRKYNICECGSKKLYGSKYCKNCNKIKYRKVERPSYEILKNEIDNCGYSSIGKKYKVSGNCIKKWINFYEKYH
jgi:very-short-patch-repair endonuclease